MLDLKKQRLLVLAPHPDDEVLGCAGLIKRIKDAGGKVYVLFLTVGNTKDYSKKGLSTSAQRLSEIEKVAKFLKFDDYTIAFPGDKYHLQLDKISQKDLIAAVDNGPKVSFHKVKPTIVATTQTSDYNQDHRACAEAVFAATRPAPAHLKLFQKIVLGYEFAPSSWSSSTLKQPNFFIDLSKRDLKTKITAMKLYSSQYRSGYHPRSEQSIKALAYMRGTQSGVLAAEAFYCYRILI